MINIFSDCFVCPNDHDHNYKQYREGRIKNKTKYFKIKNNFLRNRMEIKTLMNDK